MEQNIKSDNQEQNLEFNKIQGFDVLEKLPEDSKMKSYNEEYYSSLSNLKFVSITIPQENKLFYHFEQNPNASVTTTTGQMYVVYKDLKEATLEIKQILGEVEEAIQTIYGGVEECDKVIFDEINPEIRKIERNLQQFLVNQTTENFKLIKEIAILEKEKADLVSKMEMCVAKLDRIEKEIGFKKKNTLYNDNKTLQNAPKNTSVNHTFSSENPKAFGDTVSVK